MHPTLKPSVIVLVDEVALYLGDTIWDEVTPADVLRCAAIYIDAHGWYHDSLYREEKKARAYRLLTTPPACAYGAIGMAVFGRPVPRVESDALTTPEHWRLYNRSCAALDDYLTLDASTDEPATYEDDEDVYGVGYVHGDVWNDVPGRTCREVIYALQTAAGYYTRTHTPTGGAR